MNLPSWLVSDAFLGTLAASIPAALVALGVGYAGARIAGAQTEIQAAQLNLDLFERRFAVFMLTWEFLSRPIQHGAKSALEVSVQNELPKAQFLFGDDVRAYMKQALDMVQEMHLIDLRTSASGNVMPPEDIKRYREISEWLAHEASVGCRMVFGPYLDFSAWRAARP
jgi:hypothetical protein